MKRWSTIITAIDPDTGKLVRWIGPQVPGETREEAEAYCQSNGLGYCVVSDEINEVCLPEGLLIFVDRRN